MAQKRLPVEEYCLPGGPLFRLRWVTLAAVLLLALPRPMSGRTDLPLWALILLFAGYNLVIEVLRARVRWLQSAARVALLDLPVAGALYFLGAAPGGPLYVILLLVLICAAASMTLRSTLIYTVAVAALTTVISPTLPLWSPETGDLRELGARVIVIGFVGVGTNLLVRHLIQEQAGNRSAQGEAERLAELDRLRAEFVATISHDLRTPLTAARAGAGMLEAQVTARLAPAERQLLGNVRRNIERLGMLIDDLVTLNQLEAGALRLDQEPLDLRTVVADAMSAVHVLIGEKQQQLEVDLPEPLPAEGDARRLEQAVVNVLANANRHTPPGTHIRVTGRPVDGRVQLSVCDTGPGIPPAELEAIFQRFHRLPSGDNGSGLGLAIARSLVELQGGRLWAESEPGEGSAFHIALPRYPTRHSV